MNQSKTNNQQELSQGITKIAVSGFKSLVEECAIEVRPLTILAGANSSGKSSIMQPLLLMKQTLEAPYDPGALLLNGANVKFTKTGQFFSRLSANKKNKLEKFEINIQVNLSDNLKMIFAPSNNQELGRKLLEMLWQRHPDKINYKLYMNHDEINDNLSIYKSLHADKDIARTYNLATVRNRCFFLFQSPDATSTYQTHNIHADIISKLIHVPALRGLPERNYPITAIGDKLLSA